MKDRRAAGLPAPAGRALLAAGKPSRPTAVRQHVEVPKDTIPAEALEWLEGEAGGG
jgi:hypothetical protein